MPRAGGNRGRFSFFVADIGLAGDRRKKFGQQRVEEVGLLEG